MNKHPLVSIILPTYNRANTISKAIASVIKQTYNNWELIIWDDGSVDSTKDIIDKFNDNRILYFWDNNRGVATARNCAIENSSGEYIAFLDSDDQWTKNKLTTQMNVFHNHQSIDFLFSDFLNIDINGRILNKSIDKYSKFFDKMIKIKLEKDTYEIKSGFLKQICFNNFIATDTVVLKREVLKKYGFFNTTLKSSEDFELWWRLRLNRVVMGYISKNLLNRYKGIDSLSNLNIASIEAQ